MANYQLIINGEQQQNITDKDVQKYFKEEKHDHPSDKPIFGHAYESVAQNSRDKIAHINSMNFGRTNKSEHAIDFAKSVKNYLEGNLDGSARTEKAVQVSFVYIQNNILTQKNQMYGLKYSS